MKTVIIDEKPVFSGICTLVVKARTWKVCETCPHGYFQPGIQKPHGKNPNGNCVANND